MNSWIEAGLLLLLLLLAAAVGFARNPFTAIILFMPYTLVMVLIWSFLQSPDLAITEAAVGGGVTGILFFITLRGVDALRFGHEPPDNPIKRFFPLLKNWFIPLPRGRRNRLCYREQGRLRFNAALLRLCYHLVGSLCLLLILGILLAMVAQLPRFGSGQNPAAGELAQYYLSHGLAETGALNSVAGIILNYRAFDTLGESFVLFTATIAVTFLLEGTYHRYQRKQQPPLLPPKEDSQHGPQPR